MNRRRGFWWLPGFAALWIAWVVLNEQAGPVVLVSGVVVAAVVLGLSQAVLGVGSARFQLSPRAALAYAGLLAREMTTAAWAMARVILSGRGTTQQFAYHSALTDETQLYLLANAIILTPGSVAVARSGAHIRVVTVERDLATARAACQRLEASIARAG